MLRCVKYRLSGAPQDYWDFIHEYGTIFQSKAYLNCQASISREPLVLIVCDDHDKIIGGAGVTIGPQILHLRSGTSMCFGPVVANKEKVPDVFNCLTKVFKSMSLTCSVEVLPEHASILNENNCLKCWVKMDTEYLHWDISGPIESLYKKLPKGKKAAIKRARREEVIIEEISSDEQVEQFYRLHTLSMERGGKPPKTLLYYKNLIKMLKPKGMSAGFLALHPLTKQPIASVILLLGMHGEATYWAVGHDYEFRNLGSTDLLVLHCVEFLKSKGFVTFDLFGLPKGDSPRAKGIRHFKMAWAGDNGYRLPSYVLRRGICGLNPDLIRKSAFFTKKCVRILRRVYWWSRKKTLLSEILAIVWIGTFSYVMETIALNTPM